MKRRSLAILMSFIVVALLLCPVIAFGYVKEGEAEATLLQEGEYDLVYETKKDYSAPVRGTMSAEDNVYNQLLSAPSSVNVSNYNISVDDISAFWGNVINDHPDLFFLSSTIYFTYYPSTNTVAYVTPFYAIDTSEIAAAQEIFYEGRDRALEEVDGSMNDLQKAIVIHDYICNLANYPSVYDENGNYDDDLDKDIYHSAYGFFYDQTVVCAGYSLAYSYLMNELDVPCEYVASDDMQHAWNNIYIDGNWYNADLTYDDFDHDNGATTYGSVRHDYFIKSDSHFASASDFAIHFGGITTDSCPANDTTYDSAFWDDVTSRVFVVDGKYYYLKPSQNHFSVTLKERNQSGTESSLFVFNTMYLTYSSGYYDANGTYHSYSYYDSLGRLAYLDGKFYVAADAHIYSLVGSKRYTIETFDDDLTGLSANDDGNLFYHDYDNDFTLHELDKLQYFKDHLTMQKGVNYNNFPDINNDNVINGKDYAPIIKPLQ